MKNKFALSFKKGDLLAVLFVILSAAAVLLFTVGRMPENGVAVIYLDGAEAGRLPLGVDTAVKIKGEYTAEIEVSGGSVCVKTSDCPNGDCVRIGRIKRKGQSITCLPNRLTVVIEDGETDAVIG